MPASDQVVAVLPFHPGSRTDSEALELLHETVSRLRELEVSIVVVQDGVDIVRRWRNVQTVDLYLNSGKVHAARAGFQTALEQNVECQRFGVVDYDKEQESSELRKMCEKLLPGTADALIGNRYGNYSHDDIPRHRALANHVNRLLSSSLGQSVTDLPAAMAVCTRSFADTFVSQSRSTREGIGFDWTVLARLNRMHIGDFSVNAMMRSDRTDAAKLARNFGIPLNYADRLQREHGTVLEFCRRYVRLALSDAELVWLPLGLLRSGERIGLLRRGDDLSYIDEVVPELGLRSTAATP